MNLLLTILPLALRAVSQHPLRAGLTALGVLIGVAAVVVTVALGEGAERAVQERLNSLGDSTMTIRPERVSQGSPAAALRKPRLTEREGLAIARQAPSVVRIAPTLSTSQPLLFAGYSHTATVTGTTEAYLPMHNWKVASGSTWSTTAEKTSQRVCLLGTTVVKELFGSDDPEGRVLRIGRHPFRVLGVLATKGQSQFGQDQDNVVLMPISTLRSKLLPSGLDSVDELHIQAASKEAIDSAKEESTLILRELHGLYEGAKDDFRIRGQGSFAQTQDKVVGILSLLLTSIAAISLVVGGIGIMNIMLVSVTERTREIGIALSVGATRAHILAQYLVESVLLSVGGGVLGVLFSLTAIAGLREVVSFPLSPSAESLGLAVGVSVGIGVLFGVLPARRAAQLDPIEALGRG